eukprot:760659-Hanusia_phi.AAC.6
MSQGRGRNAGKLVGRHNLRTLEVRKGLEGGALREMMNQLSPRLEKVKQTQVGRQNATIMNTPIRSENTSTDLRGNPRTFDIYCSKHEPIYSCANTNNTWNGTASSRGLSVASGHKVGTTSQLQEYRTESDLHSVKNIITRRA